MAQGWQTTPEKTTNSSAKLSPADDDNEDAAVLDLIRKRKKLRSAFGDFGDKVRISEIMEAPNIAQEENKKLSHIVVYTHLLSD